MDEAVLFKFGKWVKYGRVPPGVHPRGEKFLLKGAWSESRSILNSFNNSVID